MSDRQASQRPAWLGDDQGDADAARDAIAILRAYLHDHDSDADWLIGHATVRRHRDITAFIAGIAIEFATLYARLAEPGCTDEELRARLDAQLTAALRAG